MYLTLGKRSWSSILMVEESTEPEVMTTFRQERSYFEITFDCDSNRICERKDVSLYPLLLDTASRAKQEYALIQITRV